jgi:sulfoxide reductase heme-binding subunit YedZ
MAELTAPSVRRRSSTVTAGTIAAFCAAAAAGASLAVLTGHGLGANRAEDWQFAARYTARFSFLVFLPVFVASAWNRLAPSALSKAVLRRRRALGLAFATAHTVHLAALTTYTFVSDDGPDAVTLLVGGGAYVATFFMAITSSDRAVKRLGRNWVRLHKVGLYWLWFVFTYSYAGRVAEGRLGFVPFLAAGLAGLALRIVAWRKRRARRADAPALAA